MPAYAVLILFSITTLIPFAWMLSASLKPEKDVLRFPVQWIPEVMSFANYEQVFEEIPFAAYLLNSLKLAATICVIQVFTSSMCGFAFAKLRFHFKKGLFMIYLASMMIPSQVIMIPQFQLMKALGLYNSHAAIICLQAFSTFGVFLMKQFMSSLPTSMLESATIDGAGYFRTFITIVIPLCVASISSLAIITFIMVMNDFMTPFLYLDNPALKTLTLGLRSLATEYDGKNAAQMAGTVCALIPMMTIYVLGQKQIVKGIAFNGGGSVKG